MSVFETGAVRELPLSPSQDTLDLEKLFTDDAFNSTHPIWVKSLAVELFTLFGSDALAQVAAKQTKFATAMVPLLTKALLTTTNTDHHRTLEKVMKLFFRKTFENVGINKAEVRNYFDVRFWISTFYKIIEKYFIIFENFCNNFHFN